MIRVDAVVVGGGIAGLWTLRELIGRGHSAVLLEAGGLGEGQTVWSQGIIHGGLKYTLRGGMNESARAIREMPGVWADRLEGRAEPDLSSAPIRARFCHLWRTERLSSVVGMLGARAGLRVAPTRLEPGAWPAALRGLRGEVYRLDERVIDPPGVLAALAAPVWGRLMRIDRESLAIGPAEDGVRVGVGLAGATAQIEARAVVVTAGLGNPAVAAAAGAAGLPSQRRPLQMLLVRGGALPELHGHCVDAAHTRVTITSARDAEGRTVWQVGGQIAETGARLEPGPLIDLGRAELAACVPGADLSGAEWSTYAADRAEGLTASGRRPDDVSLHESGRVIVGWPTKLALAPRLAGLLADAVAARVAPRGVSRVEWGGDLGQELGAWPRPGVAVMPWDEPGRRWVR